MGQNFLIDTYKYHLGNRYENFQFGLHGFTTSENIAQSFKELLF